MIWGIMINSEPVFWHAFKELANTNNGLVQFTFTNLPWAAMSTDAK
jgi:hypothetical protein